MSEGTVHSTKQNGNLTVLKYNNATDILIQFNKTGFEKKTTASYIRSGVVRDLLYPAVVGVGYFGVGEHRAKIEGRMTKAYDTWYQMFQRCYAPRSKTVAPSYYNICSVCDEWHNFQVFAEWFYKDTYRKEDWHLDKDLLVKGNKVYSPSTCCFVPSDINAAFIKSDKARGEFPIGVSFSSCNRGDYIAYCNIGDGITTRLGRYHCPDLAFYAYKLCKENYLVLLAEEYKDVLDNKVYNALRIYKVEKED